MPWDTAYFMAKARKAWLNTSSTEFAPYFSLGACMEGINILTHSLYGVRLESVPVLTGEVWAGNIHKLAVTDEEEGTLGHIYCDFYERPGKPNQDCHFTIRGGKQLPDGSYQVSHFLYFRTSAPELCKVIPKRWKGISRLRKVFLANISRLV